MRLEQILTPKRRVKKGNEGDQEAIPLFAAFALTLVLADASRAGHIGSMSDYARATTRWFNREAPTRPFPFQSKPHRESEFRKGMSDVLNKIIAGLVAGDRSTPALIGELKVAADRYLTEFVLVSMGRHAEMASREDVWSICVELRHKRSIAHLLSNEKFDAFCDAEPPAHVHERHLRLAGRIARELFA